MRFAVLLSLAAAFAIASDLPDGKGKDVVETACSDCHSLERIKAERRNEEGWNSLIHEMLENGANLCVVFEGGCVFHVSKLGARVDQNHPVYATASA